jgi:hypothetical protein
MLDLNALVTPLRSPAVTDDVNVAAEDTNTRASSSAFKAGPDAQRRAA